MQLGASTSLFYLSQCAIPFCTLSALFAETLALMAWPLCSGKIDRTYGLLLKTVILDEATPSSVQCSEAYFGFRRPDYRPENRRLSTTHRHQ